jgi:hypothetical protein
MTAPHEPTSGAFANVLITIRPWVCPIRDRLERDGALIMGKIRGNPEFGLAAGETLNLIAAQSPCGGGELATFWLWFEPCRHSCC